MYSLKCFNTPAFVHFYGLVLSGYLLLVFLLVHNQVYDGALLISPSFLVPTCFSWQDYSITNAHYAAMCVLLYVGLKVLDRSVCA